MGLWRKCAKACRSIRKGEGMVKFQRLVGTVWFFFLFLFPSLSLAYYSVGESGNLVDKETYEIGLSPHFTLNNSGVNMSAFFGFAYGEESSIRTSVGAGDSFSFLAISGKWIPFPRHESQPAVGVKIEGMHVGYSGTSTSFSLRAMPLVSTSFFTSSGVLTPYFSLPIGFIFPSQSSSQATLQTIVGSEFKSKYYPQWKFGGELGFNINNSPSYIMGYAAYFFSGKTPSSRH